MERQTTTNLGFLGSRPSSRMTCEASRPDSLRNRFRMIQPIDDYPKDPAEPGNGEKMAQPLGPGGPGNRREGNREALGISLDPHRGPGRCPLDPGNPVVVLQNPWRKLSRDPVALRRSAISSSRIGDFIAYYNKHLAKPFQWTFNGKLLKV